MGVAAGGDEESEMKESEYRGLAVSKKKRSSNRKWRARERVQSREDRNGKRGGCRLTER